MKRMNETGVRSHFPLLVAALALAAPFAPLGGPATAAVNPDVDQLITSLNPKLAEAYHYLVGYYLNAPPIAGGSVDKAEETARVLAGLDPDGGERLLAQIAAHRESSSHPGGSQ